jgi:hypothetical protein
VIDVAGGAEDDVTRHKNTGVVEFWIDGLME